MPESDLDRQATLLGAAIAAKITLQWAPGERRDTARAPVRDEPSAEARAAIPIEQAAPECPTSRGFLP
jgi:hypothetical protein